MSTPEDEHARLQQVRRSALGSRLRQLRAARNLSQEALARRAGMDRSFYSNIETGAVSPESIDSGTSPPPCTCRSPNCSAMHPDALSHSTSRRRS